VVGQQKCHDVSDLSRASDSAERMQGGHVPINLRMGRSVLGVADGGD
jgi:hypothetical protein